MSIEYNYQVSTLQVNIVNEFKCYSTTQKQFSQQINIYDHRNYQLRKQDH